MIRFVVLVCALAASTAVSSLNLRASPINPRATIIQNAKLGQFPYQASLISHGGHYCGGTILNKRWILSAAGCFYSGVMSDLQVAVGTIQRNGPFAKLYNVADVIIHEDYNQFDLYNDIGLIRVTEDIEFNDNVQPCELETEDLGGGVPVNITGWARTQYPDKEPEKLQWVTLPTFSVEECQDQHYAAIVPSQICTYASCQDDPGSPIVRNGKVCGVLSWTLPCFRTFPDVYTRVSSFADWINAKINN